MKSQISNLKSAPELPLFRIGRENRNIEWLLNLLRARGWLTRNDILRAAGASLNDYNRRWVRALAEAAGPEVVRGQKGFNHLANCTPDEINHAANQAMSQGRLMLRYGLRLRRRAHEILG